MSPPAEWPYRHTVAPAVSAAMTRQRAVQLRVVAGQVGGEVRRLAGEPRSSALVQVQGVEGEAAGGEVVGEFGVEEVVGVTVQREYGVLGADRLPAPDERGNQLALTVGIRAEQQWSAASIRAARRAPIRTPTSSRQLP